MIKKILLILLTGALLISCRKEENDSFPEITFHSPIYLAPHAVFDTVKVQATISGEKALTNIRVKLTDSGFSPVSSTTVFYPEGTNYELNTKIVIDDPALESGHYYVHIRAENGDNFKNKYQEIIIQALEQEFKQLIILTEGTSNSIQVYGTEDLEATSKLAELQGDFTASAISSFGNLLFIAGENQLNLLAFNLLSNTVEWQKQKTPGLPMHNPDCLYFEDLLYTTYNFNFIHGYSLTGQIDYDVYIDDLDAPEIIFKHNDYILTEVQRKNAVDPFIATTFALTGNEKQRMLISNDVVAFSSVDQDHVLIVFNSENSSSIYLYDVQNNLMSFRKEIPEVINTTVDISGETLVLAGEENIYAYSNKNEALFTILEKGASILAWEQIQEVLLIGFEDRVEGYLYPEMVNQKTLQFSDTILDMQIQYIK